MEQAKHPQPVDSRMARNYPSLVALFVAFVEVVLGFLGDPRLFVLAVICALVAVVIVLVDINEHLHELVQRQPTDTPE